MQITDEMLYQHAEKARELWLDTLPQKDEVPAAACSPRLQRKMDRLLRQQRRSPKVNRVLRNMKRIAAVFLIAVTVAFAGLMSVEATRQKVIEAFANVYRELTRYEYSSNKEALALPELRFEYLPAGMELRSDVTGADYSRVILWKSDAGLYLCFHCYAVSIDRPEALTVDTTGAQITSSVMGDMEVTVISRNGSFEILWADENAHYIVTGNLELPELQAFVEGLSVKP